MLGRIFGGAAGDGRAATSGNVSIVFGLMSATMLFSVGAAVDGANWLRARDVTARAIDAALLAGARRLFESAGDRASAAEAAMVVYSANIKRRVPLARDSIAFAALDDGTAMVARGSATLETGVLRLFGLGELQLFPGAPGDLARGVLTLGANAKRNVEIALVLDVSRSVEALLEPMLQGASDLVELLLWAEQSRYSLRVALVPFAGGVDPGDVVLNGGAPAPRSMVRLASGALARWGATPCVGERGGGATARDAAPGTAVEFPHVYSPAGICPSHGHVIALSNDRSALKGALATLTAAGGSAPHVGLAWASYALSPNWRHVWPEGAAPMAYIESQTQIDGASAKAVVLVTAGGFDAQFCNASAPAMVEGVAVPDRDSAQSANLKGACLAPGGTSADQTAGMCEALKQRGIEIFTIALAPATEFARSILRQCASSGEHALVAEDAIALRLAYREIAGSIPTVYLAD